jgi:hypothetical protein
MLSSSSLSVLASAYELLEDDVAADATQVHQWVGSDLDLIVVLETRHGWDPESKVGQYYVAAVRRALA